MGFRHLRGETLLEDCDQNTDVYYERWSKTDSVYSLLEWYVFLTTIGSVEGLDVLDVACGEECRNLAPSIQWYLDNPSCIVLEAEKARA